MNGLDLFSGIGGLTKALEGYVRPVAYCENDRYSQAILLSRMASGELPAAPIWDDVQSLRGTFLPPPIDIIYGGFPCQDISVAGRGVGLAGKRSGLFFEIIRLAGELQPRFIFLENVPAIRSRGADVVVGELARLGYDARWITLSAAEIGANHRRDRWWLLAHANDTRRQGAGKQPDRFESSREDVAKSDSQPIAGIKERGAERPKQDSPRAGWWTAEPPVGRVANGVRLRVDRLRGLGNAVVPAQAREAFERLMGFK